MTTDTERALPAVSPSDAIEKRTAQLRYTYALSSIPASVRPVIEEYVAVLEKGVLAEWEHWTRIHERELLPSEDAVTSRMLDGNIGYVDLANVRPGVPREFRRTLAALLKDGARSLVVDLRDNGGSNPEDAVRIVSEFIDSGTVVKLRGLKSFSHDAIAGGVATNPNIRVVVLQNRFSASGVEVVTAALQHHKRAIVVGGQSFAKTWTWRRAPDGTEMRSGDWLDPAGRSVGPRGVQPDIRVADVRDDDRDAILAAAIKALADD